MFLFDVNIYVYMHRKDSVKHEQISDFALEVINSGKLFGYSPLALSGFLRIVTHPKIFKIPTDFETAISFTESIISHPNVRAILPGNSHWHIFRHLCYRIKPEGNLYPDAFFAALAIDSGCTWVSCDSDYTRFPGLDCNII